MWTYEEPIDIDIPDADYDAEFSGTEHGYCDVVFANGVVFGYVELKDIGP